MQVVKEIAREFYKDMVKGVVDIEREVMALGGEWHMDSNQVLIKDGSKQYNVWGFNIYLNRKGKDRVEYTSLINIRPVDGNRSMEVKSFIICDKMYNIINKLII
ncbi:MAG: hypothetical protein COV57_01950 [Candidatus Liptonbacteria bacterium CG11_big_fil_rev_8_21_14_0_20_35_14]|uniref:Uncharacterized protein n=1 Tax=Candidatus Liptonbacteria bacterium CG11_big_fil_rev_8_21_14_0_20_35_14 TaxID=1974634 RepID=A0A2H0N7P3_9BACT|nr:MAG: hypothetical protein COV57_01950 [Candidatus Liptonbacteria bacterium CG11_big_fil_rev_8_21_14_0_20_35_14]